MSASIQPQIVAMGGGGFSMEPENPLLDEYVLSLAKPDNPSVCFIPTASADSEGYTLRFYQAFTKLGARPCHLSLYNAPARDLRKFILEQDVIYVGGGNTRNMLALWRAWELDTFLHEAWQKGIIMAGISAGMNCWFEACITDSTPQHTGNPADDLTTLPCMGWLQGSSTPHYDGEEHRRAVYQKYIASGAIPSGIAADDSVAAHVIGTEIHKFVSSRPNAKAYRIVRRGDAAEETLIEPEYLGKG